MDILSYLIPSNWIVWIIIIAIVILILWFFLRENEPQEFIGLAPLHPNYYSLAEKGMNTSNSNNNSNYNNNSNSNNNSNDNNNSNNNFNDNNYNSNSNSNNIQEKYSLDDEEIEICQDIDSLEIPENYKIDVSNCGKSKGETICRQVLEQIYKVPFPTIRPNILRNPETNRNLELDGYNEDLKIAFEYNGKQHYVYPNAFHKTEQQFDNQLRRDAFKLDKCDEHGIYLITIPYTVPHDVIPAFIEYFLPEEVQKRIDNGDHVMNPPAPLPKVKV